MIKRNLLIILVLAALLRFPNSLIMVIGVLSVMAIWVLMGQLFSQSNGKWVKEVSALFLAISPWHLSLINYSWKISFAILVAIVGSALLLNSVKSIKWLLLLIAALVIIASQFYKPLELRLSNSQVPVWLTDEQRREHGQDYNHWETKLFHNKVVNYSLSFLEHYGEHFSGDFLFIVGDTNLVKKDGGFGQMYLFDILFLLIGFYAMIRKFEWSSWGIILLWLILSPINSALTFNPPDSLRSALMVVPLTVISSFGALTLFNVILQKTKRLYN